MYCRAWIGQAFAVVATNDDAEVVTIQTVAGGTDGGAHRHLPRDFGEFVLNFEDLYTGHLATEAPTNSKR